MALGAGSWVDRAGSIPVEPIVNMAVILGFARVMGQAWTAIGLRGLYGCMADLTTEPRWSRAHETFTQDADLMTGIVGELIGVLKGSVDAGSVSLSSRSSVAPDTGKPCTPADRIVAAIRSGTDVLSQFGDA